MRWKKQVSKCINAVLIVVIMMFFTSCGHANIKLNINDNDRSFKVSEGQSIIIELEAIPTTGYIWEVTDIDKDIIEKVGEPEYYPESNAVGAKGMRVFTFKVVGKGKTHIKIIQHRPWEKSTEPLKTFLVNITVKS